MTTPLIDVAALAARLATATPPTLLDVRWRLTGSPGRNDYLHAHIPGAVFIDLDRDLCGRPGAGGRHPLPDPTSLQSALRDAGVREGHPVVAYGDTDPSAAARLWWTLRWAGHREVQVLDGGLPAWLAAGRPVEPGEVVAVPGDITVRPGGMPVLDGAGAADLARAGHLLDARVPGRYRGEMEPVDPVAGHIPGAVNLPLGDLIGGDGRLRPAAELRERFATVGVAAGPVGAYCGSGVTAAATVLALASAGIEAAPLYVGSWSNWITDPAREVATG